MEKNHESSPVLCLNCGAMVNGVFCQQCGQKMRDNTDRSIRRLIGEFLGNIFFLDNRFLLSLRYLFGFPGRMTVEYLNGKRRKFISPVTLFLFINLIYFMVSPLSDYSLPLEDQYYSQIYSTWIQDMVVQKIESKGIDGKEYGPIYKNMSDNISKSIMIINIPMIALLVYLMSFKKRAFYFDSLIYAFHFFSLFMVSWILLAWLGDLLDHIPGFETSIFSTVFFQLFSVGIPIIYAVLSMRHFMSIRWYWSIPAGFGVMVSVLLSNLVYRFIILVLTLWMA